MSGDPVRELGAERIGTVLLGKYRLERILGSGGMAIVYAATHRNQKRFAVKVLHPELARSKDLRERFLREGYLANSVDHPGAVAVLDDDDADDGAAVLVMELLLGNTVEAVQETAGGRLSPQVVLGIAYDLLDVLAAAHGHGIVHRDIKPANLFLTKAGTVKVLDFGIARVREAMGGGAGATTTGMMLGTPAFMAPEQAGGRASLVDHRTDLWAVGATMFSLLTSELVHAGETAQHVALLAATTPARKLATVLPGIDPSIAAVVDRALAFEASERWQSAAQMREAVGEAGLACFGGPLGSESQRASMAELVAAAERRTQSLSETVADPGARAAAPPQGPPVVDARSVPSVATSVPSASLASPTASHVGVTTEQWAGLPRPGRAAYVLGAAGLLAALGLVVTYTARGQGSSEPPLSTAAPSSETAAPSSASSALDTTTLSPMPDLKPPAIDPGSTAPEVAAKPPSTSTVNDDPAPVASKASQTRTTHRVATHDAGAVAAPRAGGARDWDKP